MALESAHTRRVHEFAQFSCRLTSLLIIDYHLHLKININLKAYIPCWKSGIKLAKKSERNHSLAMLRILRQWSRKFSTICNNVFFFPHSHVQFFQSLLFNSARLEWRTNLNNLYNHIFATLKNLNKQNFVSTFWKVYWISPILDSMD